MPTAAANINDPVPPTADNVLLRGIQGNILKPHGRGFVRLIFFRFVENSPKYGTIALRQIFPDALGISKTGAANPWDLGVTSAYDQWLDTRMGNLNTPFYSFGITRAGLRHCAYQDNEMPPMDGGEMGFGSDMHDPVVFTQFGDKVGKGAEKTVPVDWEPDYRPGFDGFWLLAHAVENELDGMEGRVASFLNDHDAAIVHREDGFSWKDCNKHPREPFGFRDGLSDPPFFMDDCDITTGTPLVPPWINILRSKVLIRKKGHQGGSFMVLRKLEQNVQLFRDIEGAIQKKFNDLPEQIERPAEAGALLIGRERNGRPLADTMDPNEQEYGPNQFDFQSDQSRCPLHAHIRKVVPRANQFQGVTPHHDTELARGRLFVRRSVVYDKDKAQLPPSGTLDDSKNASADVAPATYRSKIRDQVITKDVGLLFMGYMSRIDLQFFQIQMDWFQNQTFPFSVPPTNLGDPILRPEGAPTGKKALPWSWQGISHSFEAPVTARGGAYFYVPSITWLENQSAKPKNLLVRFFSVTTELLRSLFK